MKKVFLLLFFLASAGVRAQCTIDNFLEEIAANNPGLQANAQLWEARKLQYKTGIYLTNPMMGFDYMKGTPAGEGNQRDFIITQAFDFPTIYRKRNQLADQRIAQAEHQQRTLRQNILLEAKLLLLELVYQNKLTAELKQRLRNAASLQQDFETKLAKGDGNILDVNKAKLQRIAIENALRKTETQKRVLAEKLNSLNGGKAVFFQDTIYSAVPDIPAFEVIEKTIEENDPSLKYYLQETVVAAKEVEVSRAMRLPKFEAGYHSQAILGQTFRGAHLGVSIPLWENKNLVKYHRAQARFAELQVNQHRTEHYHEVLQQYEQYTNLKKTLDDYKQALQGINSSQLLRKALRLGEISTIQYYLEMSYFYTAIDSYLGMELEYNQSVAVLNRYAL